MRAISLLCLCLVVAFGASAEAAKQFRIRVPAFEIIVEAEEVTPAPEPDESKLPPASAPEDDPNEPGLALKVRDGQFFESRTGKPFRDLSVNLAGDACLVSDAELDRMFDRIEACGCRLVRTLHVAVDDKAPDRISHYQPTIDEWRAGFPFLDRIVAQCKKRGMYLWITLHHRQRLTLEQAKALGVDAVTHGPRDAGIYPGEIAELFLVLPQLEKLVGDYCLELATRYKEEPTVALITIANEKVRYKGYTPLVDRVRTDNSWKPYREEWFRRFDEYAAIKGLTDRTTHQADLNRFHAWNACRVYGRILNRLRTAGVRQLVGTSNGLGDCRMDVLPILAVGNFIDWHVYGFLAEGMPDPFIRNDVRDLSSIAAALRIRGYPLVLGEHADVHERKKLMLPSYSDGPRAVAEAGFDVSNHYCAFLGPIGFGKLYNGFDVPGFEIALKQARADFLALPPPQQTYHELTEADVFGEWKKIDGVWRDVLPPIVGTVRYGADGVVLPWRLGESP